MLDGVTVSEASAVFPSYSLLRSLDRRIDEIRFHRDALLSSGVGFSESDVRHDIELLSGVKSRLVINPLMQTPPSIKALMDELGSLDEHIVRLFGARLKKDWKAESPAVRKLLDEQREVTAVGRASELAFRIEMEVHEKVRHGWFIIMDTLTVSADKMNEVFVKGSKIWRSYIDKFRRSVGSAVCGGIRAYKRSSLTGTDVHTYAAVVEKGELTGRLHIHVLHFCRAIPHRASDPVVRSPGGAVREIVALKSLWPYGLSTPIAARFHANDAFGRAGWLWPTERVAGVYVPIDPSDPATLANYLSKYLVKSYQEKDGYIWRTKLSRNLGLNGLKMVISSCETETLCSYLISLRSSQNLPSLRRRKLPCALVRRLALKDYVLRKECANSSKKMISSLMRLEVHQSLSVRLRMMVTAHSAVSSEVPKIISTTMRKSRLSAISDFSGWLEYLIDELGLNERKFVGPGRPRRNL